MSDRWIRRAFCLNLARCVSALGVTLMLLAAATQVYVTNAAAGQDLPTPTCPQGVMIYFSREVMHRCWEERIDLYLPDGFYTLPSYFFWGGVVHMVSLALIAVACRRCVRARRTSYLGLALMILIIILWVLLELLFYPLYIEIVPGPTPLVFPE